MCSDGSLHNRGLEIMSEMVERVARAILAAERAAPEPDAPVLLGLKTVRAWEARLPLARAALDAMREPTDDMWAAVPVINDPNDWGAREVWHAMIDEALK